MVDIKDARKLRARLVATIEDGGFRKMESVDSPQVTVGLCATCRNAKILRSDRGSVFYRCELSAIDPRFPKYPRLPVLACDGYALSAS